MTRETDRSEAVAALAEALHGHAVDHRDVLPCNERCAPDLAARVAAALTDPDPVECAICGDYSSQGVEVHEVCLDMLSRTVGSTPSPSEPSPAEARTDVPGHGSTQFLVGRAEPSPVRYGDDDGEMCPTCMRVVGAEPSPAEGLREALEEVYLRFARTLQASGTLGRARTRRAAIGTSEAIRWLRQVIDETALTAEPDRPSGDLDEARQRVVDAARAVLGEWATPDPVHPVTRMATVFLELQHALAALDTEAGT